MKKILSIILFINLIIPITFGTNVTPGDKICQEEKEYIKNRKTVVKAAIREITGCTDKTKKLPKIDICLSGGGYRSMISSLGFINGTEQNNLFQASRYISALSGSTWLLIPLITHKTIPYHYTEYLKRNVSTDFLSNEIFKDAIKKYRSTKNKNAFIASWGKILSDHLLNKNDNLTLKKARELLNKTTYYPFPIFSCTIANSLNKKDRVPYSWLEISPYATYSKYLGGTIPTSSLGNKFKNGSQQTKYPELSSSFLMGIFGSPFCMSIGDILNFSLLELGEKLHFESYKYLNWFETEFESLNFYKKHFFPATIPNYSYGLKQSKLRATKNLELIDGGFFFNLPMEALFRRKSDIIIICDSSVDASDKNEPELQLVAGYALDHEIYFPNIEKPYAEFDNLKIFFNPNRAHIPMVIYFTNPIKDSTLKMQYNSEDFDILHNIMQKLVLDNTENIATAIKLKIEQLNI